MSRVPSSTSYAERLEKVLLAKRWLDRPPPKGMPVVYMWANDRAVLGIGKHSGAELNDRVNPDRDRSSVMSCKDAGKKMLAAFVGKRTGQPMSLYWRKDPSEERSKITTKLEVQLRETLFRGDGRPFMEIDGRTYKKVEYMDEVFVPAVRRQFGHGSLEDVLATNAAGDGDVWSRVARHPLSELAIVRIIDELCLVA